MSKISKKLTLALLFIVSNQAHSAGFALNDQSATYLGNAYAGTCSAAQDASTGYYNPAGLSELAHSQLLLGSTYIKQNIRLIDGFATNNAGNPITGNNPTKPKANLLIPYGHVALRASKRFSFGLSVIEPFGLNTRYMNSDIAHLMASENKITVVDISPSIGYKINSAFSIGAGLDFLRLKTRISSGDAWGSNSPEKDGYVINTASKWVMGYHLGVLLKPCCNTNVGIAYFSSFKPRFSGDTQSYAPLDFNGVTGVSYTLNLPDHINVGVTQRVNSRFTTMGEVQWTHWSKLKTLVMNYNAADVSPGIKTFHFKNTWRISLGGDYKVGRMLTLKGGVGYDQSPNKSAYRSAMLPDSSQYLLALGARITLNKQFSFVAGYSHSFYRKTSIAEMGSNDGLNQSPNVANKSTLNAQVKNATDKFGLQLVFNFI